MKKSPDGSISIQSDRGRIRIALPRSLWEDKKQRFIYPLLTDTPENRLKAKVIVSEIEIDLLKDRFDFTLKKYQPSSYKPVQEACLQNLWFDYVEHKSKFVSVTTLNKDLKRVSSLILKLPTQKLSESKKIYRWLIQEFSPEAVKRYLQQINACCEWAKNEERIDSNPFAKLKPPKYLKQEEIKPFTFQERDRIIKGFRENFYYSHYTQFVEFLFLTGCRTSEAIALRWENVNSEYINFCEAFVDGTFKGTKTGKNRRFPVNEPLAALLAETQELYSEAGVDLVFPSPEGLYIDSRNFSRRGWRSVLAQNDIVYRKLYNTRHSFISWCLESGVTVQQIALWVGNSPNTIYRFYAGIASSANVPDFTKVDPKK